MSSLWPSFVLSRIIVWVEPPAFALLMSDSAFPMKFEAVARPHSNNCTTAAVASTSQSASSEAAAPAKVAAKTATQLYEFKHMKIEGRPAS